MRVVTKGWFAVAAIAFAIGCAAKDGDPTANSEGSEKRADALTGTQCGGLLAIACPKGFVCVDVPDDGCDPQKGGADCPGVCVSETPAPFSCGGLLGIECPAGPDVTAKYACVDDWRDDCDPTLGGADCPGLCLPSDVQLCGGPNDPACMAGLTCVAAPALDCTVSADGEAACSTGVCVLADSE